jgi:hypothetical protein
MRTTTVTWLALRELWISFRLLLLLGAVLAGGIAGALLPELALDPSLLAIGLAAASVLLAGMSARTMARERGRGMMAWLAVRGVPRSVMVIAWLGAFAFPIVLGGAGAGVLGWLSSAVQLPPPIDPLSYGAIAASAVAGVVVVVTLGFVLGAILRPVPAALLAILLAAAIAAPGLLALSNPPWLPTAGFGLLVNLSALERPLADGLRTLGLAVAAIAVLIVLAGVFLEATDL